MIFVEMDSQAGLVGVAPSLHEWEVQSSFFMVAQQFTVLTQLCGLIGNSNLMCLPHIAQLAGLVSSDLVKSWDFLYIVY